MIASAEGSEMLFAAKPNVLRLTNIHTAIVEIHNAVNSSLAFFFALRHVDQPLIIEASVSGLYLMNCFQVPVVEPTPTTVVMMPAGTMMPTVPAMPTPFA